MARKSHRFRPLSVALLALSAGCKVGPDYVEPRLPLDAAFINTDAFPPGDLEPLAAWWTVFDDPVLTTLIEQAIAHNHDIRIAEANLLQARELLIEARFELYPIAPARAGYERVRRSDFAARGGGRNFSVFTGGFDATWELDIFGGVRRNIESREATVGAFEADRRDVLVSVVAEVARNYFELRGNQRRLEVARQNAENQADTFDLTVTLLEGGRGTDLDTSRAKSQLESTLATIPPLETLVEQTMYRIAVLTGQQPAALLEILSPLATIPDPAQPLAIGTPVDLIRRRPDVRAAERQLAASTAFVGVATADLYPRITVQGSLGFETADGGSGFSGGMDTFSIGPRLSWAAFDLGRVRARVRATEAQAEADLAFFEQTVLIALEEVDSALLAYGKEMQRHQHLVAAEEASRRAAELARLRFEDGVADFLAVLDAERRTLETQDQLAESATRVATLLIAVYKALGGGWETTEPAIPES